MPGEFAVHMRRLVIAYGVVTVFFWRCDDEINRFWLREVQSHALCCMLLVTACKSSER